MQLKLGGGLALLGLVLSTPAGAKVEGALQFTHFREPSNSNAGITVLHPQAEVTAALEGSAGITAGYEMDIVSGATPRVYGVDAVTSATSFSDTRQAAHGAVGLEVAEIAFSGAYSYGWESDYKSHTLSASARGDFQDRNLTLGMAYTRNIDSVCDQNNDDARSVTSLRPLTASTNCFVSDQEETVTRRLDIHTFEPSLVWTVTPRLLVQLGGTLQILDGFQSNPYRSVLIGNLNPQEHLPEQRQRYAGFARAHYAIPSTRSALQTTARVYRDSWDLWAGTGEVKVSQYLAPAVIIDLRGRYHHQTGAVFYRRGRDLQTRGPAGQYWTGDRELAPFQTWTGGIKLAYLKRPAHSIAWYEEIELSLKFDLAYYQVEEGGPNSDRPVAFITQAGAGVRF